MVEQNPLKTSINKYMYGSIISFKKKKFNLKLLLKKKIKQNIKLKF